MSCNPLNINQMCSCNGLSMSYLFTDVSIDAPGSNTLIETGSASGIVITLPTGTIEILREYIIKNSNGFTVVINTYGGKTIDGALSINLSSFDSARIVYNGTNWLII